VQLEVEAPEEALVVIAQTFYHDWRAYVDNRPVPLLRANQSFQALQVSPGRHQVTLRYEDRAFFYGALLSLLSAVTLAGLWFRSRKQVTEPR
jgi:uncharacterized membrane protein YfhO